MDQSQKQFLQRMNDMQRLRRLAQSLREQPTKRVQNERTNQR
ncbi:hypothetical protein VPHD479_0175 [Vibrio phage D479]